MVRQGVDGRSHVKRGVKGNHLVFERLQACFDLSDGIEPSLVRIEMKYRTPRLQFWITHAIHHQPDHFKSKDVRGKFTGLRQQYISYVSVPPVTEIEWMYKNEQKREKRK